MSGISSNQVGNEKKVIATYNLVDLNGQLLLEDPNTGDSIVNIIGEGQEVNLENITKNVSFEFCPRSTNDVPNVVVAGQSNKTEEEVEPEKDVKDKTFKMDVDNVTGKEAKMLVESLNNFSQAVEKHVKDLPNSLYVNDSPQKDQFWKIIQSVIVDKKLYNYVIRKKKALVPEGIKKRSRSKRTKK